MKVSIVMWPPDGNQHNRYEDQYNNINNTYILDNVYVMRGRTEKEFIVPFNRIARITEEPDDIDRRYHARLAENK